MIPWVVMRLNPPANSPHPGGPRVRHRELLRDGSDENGGRRSPAHLCHRLRAVDYFRAPRISYRAAGDARRGSALVTGVLTVGRPARARKAAWDIFVWYGGLVELGLALNETGVTREFARAVGTTLSGAGWIRCSSSPCCVYFYAHYGFASITAHLVAMYTPFVAVLLAKGAPVGLMAFSFACFANFAAGLTNYGTTPSPMYFAHDMFARQVVSGRLRGVGGEPGRLVHGGFRLVETDRYR